MHQKITGNPDKKIPLRKCLGCNEMLEKNKLLRVVKNSGSGVSFDFSGKKNGRGAYLCRDARCFEKARKKRSFERSLKCQIPNDVYEILSSEINKIY